MQGVAPAAARGGRADAEGVAPASGAAKVHYIDGGLDDPLRREYGQVRRMERRKGPHKIGNLRLAELREMSRSATA